MLEWLNDSQGGWSLRKNIGIFNVCGCSGPPEAAASRAVDTDALLHQDV